MNAAEKEEGYSAINSMLMGLLADQNHTLSNLSNASALLKDFLKDSVFAGFYLFDGEKLLLGPFQGSVSCVEIEMGKGVCGEAAAKKKTLIVDDVKNHKNYISCDSEAASEIVVPIFKNGRLMGVLDLDAPTRSAYDELDQKHLENFVKTLSDLTDWKFEQFA